MHFKYFASVLVLLSIHYTALNQDAPSLDGLEVKNKTAQEVKGYFAIEAASNIEFTSEPVVTPPIQSAFFANSPYYLNDWASDLNELIQSGDYAPHKEELINAYYAPKNVIQMSVKGGLLIKNRHEIGFGVAISHYKREVQWCESTAEKLMIATAIGAPLEDVKVFNEENRYDSYPYYIGDDYSYLYADTDNPYQTWLVNGNDNITNAYFDRIITTRQNRDEISAFVLNYKFNYTYRFGKKESKVKPFISFEAIANQGQRTTINSLASDPIYYSSRWNQLLEKDPQVGDNFIASSQFVDEDYEVQYTDQRTIYEQNANSTGKKTLGADAYWRMRSWCTTYKVGLMLHNRVQVSTGIAISVFPGYEAYFFGSEWQTLGRILQVNRFSIPCSIAYYF